MIAQVAEAIKTQGAKEANKGNVAKLEICKKSYREDIVIGDIYVVPASVCKKAENFPIALLASGVFSSLNQEEAIEARLQFLASEDMSKDTLKMAKEMLFTNSNGEVCDLVVFHPAWANISDIKVIHFNEDTLFLDLRDKVFCAMYNPALSNSFEQIKALTGAFRVESIPLQQHVFKTPSYGNAYPELGKGSEVEAEDIKVSLGEGKSIGKDALKDLKIKTTFRLIASSLVKAEVQRKKIRLSAAHIEELEESIMEPEELKLFSKIEDILDTKTKISAETGLRNRPDYGASGSKETVGPEMVDGPDPKKASDDVEADAKMVTKYLRVELRKMDKSGDESQGPRYEKMQNDLLTLEDWILSGGKNGSLDVQHIIQDYYSNMPSASDEIAQVKGLPGALTLADDHGAKIVVEMPADEFIEEHKKLVDVLEEGTDEDQFAEGEDQKDELKRVESADSDEYRVDTWFERDRAQVTLYKGDTEIASWSDEEVGELVEDGYLNPNDWLGSAIEYAQMHGLLKEASSEEILREELPMSADDWFQHEEEEEKKPVTASADGNWGVQWSEFNKKDQVVNKERTFSTEKAREKFTKGLSDKNNFRRFEAWSDPPVDKKESFLEKKAFTLMVPGQVLEGFYPEMAEQLAIQPVGREFTHSPTPEMLQMQLEKTDEGDATKGPAGMGLGPSQPQGAPLRKELNLRGPGFTNMFNAPHDDINPSSLLMASKKASKTASAENKVKLADVLKRICGQIAATLVSGFQVTQKPLFTDTPMEWTLRLNDLETGLLLANAGILPVDQTGFGFKALADGLNDTDMIDALNGAWAQAAVWNDEGDAGFTYEVFVRAEKLDIETMTLKVKYIIKKKD
jgi:hypothetical protein